MFKLTGKVSLVTGAASGIGESIAHAFAAAGAFVYVADVNDEAGRTVVEDLRRDGWQAEFVHLDVTDESECRRVADDVTKANDRLDILVNNAGIGHVGTIEKTAGADLDRLYSVNVRGVFNLTKVFIPRMIERKAGAIVNIASIGGVFAVGERLAYCTTKFAVVGLTKCLALDHATDGVRVNCVCPGRVETPFVSARLREYPDPEKAYREMSATQAIGRMGRPDEIAAAVLYLASDEAAFVTGSALVIDGGMSVGK